MTLVEAMRVALADTFAFYFKAQSFHWNVTGPSFVSLHKLFGDIYKDAQEAIDAIAEHIRVLDEFAPNDLQALLGRSSISWSKATLDANDMVKALNDANGVVISSLTGAFVAANAAKEHGLADFLQARLDVHGKWHWMLTATEK